MTGSDHEPRSDMYASRPPTGPPRLLVRWFRWLAGASATVTGEERAAAAAVADHPSSAERHRADRAVTRLLEGHRLARGGDVIDGSPTPIASGDEPTDANQEESGET